MRLGDLGILADTVDQAFDDVGRQNGRVVLAVSGNRNVPDSGAFVHGLSV
jgi:hypothetical protein